VKKIYICLAFVLMATLSCTKTNISPTQAQLNANALKKLSFKSVSVMKMDYSALLFSGDTMTIDGNGLATISISTNSGAVKVYNLGEMVGYQLDTFGNLTLYF